MVSSILAILEEISRDFRCLLCCAGLISLMVAQDMVSLVRCRSVGVVGDILLGASRRLDCVGSLNDNRIGVSGSRYVIGEW